MSATDMSNCNKLSTCLQWKRPRWDLQILYHTRTKVDQKYMYVVYEAKLQSNGDALKTSET